MLEDTPLIFFFLQILLFISSNFANQRSNPAPNQRSNVHSCPRMPIHMCTVLFKKKELCPLAPPRPTSPTPPRPCTSTPTAGSWPCSARQRRGRSLRASPSISVWTTPGLWPVAGETRVAWRHPVLWPGNGHQYHVCVV